MRKWMCIRHKKLSFLTRGEALRHVRKSHKGGTFHKYMKWIKLHPWSIR